MSTEAFDSTAALSITTEKSNVQTPHIEQGSAGMPLATIAWGLVLAVPCTLMLTQLVVRILATPVWPVGLMVSCVWSLLTTGFLLLVARRWDKITRLPRTKLAWAFIAAGIVSYAVAIACSILFFAELGWALHCGAWLASHQEHRSGARSNMLGLWPGVAFYLQWPDSWTNVYVDKYQQLLANTVATCFDALGLVYRSQRNVFEFANGSLSLSDTLAASLPIGSLLFAGWLLIAHLRRPLALYPVYLLAASMWAFGIHLVQLSVTGYAIPQRLMQVESTLFTITSMFVCAALFAALQFSSDRFLRIVFMPVPLDSSGSTTGIRRMNPLTALWSWLFLPLVGEQQEGM